MSFVHYVIHLDFSFFFTSCRHRLCKKGENEEGMWSVGNKVFSVTLDSSLDIHDLPLFGARYNFKLHDVVDLPEYLIHFSLLVK